MSNIKTIAVDLKLVSVIQAYREAEEAISKAVRFGDRAVIEECYRRRDSAAISLATAIDIRLPGEEAA